LSTVSTRTTAADRAIGASGAEPLPGRPATTLPTLPTLVAGARLELIPMGSLARASAELRPGTAVSITCSPTRTIEATLEATATLVAAGHDVTPHLSARMVRDHAHLRAIVTGLGDTGARRVFVVGGDTDPAGAFADAVSMLDAFLSLDPPVDHVGLPCYPDGHPLIDDDALHAALHRKQQLVLASGRTAHVTTQMCFSGDTIRGWVRRERATGLVVPVHLGIAGPIDRAKLATVGVRLGVGPSLRYLTKNRAALARLLGPRPYRPDRLVRSLIGGPDERGIDGLHVFTFNQVAAAEAWRDRHRA
jgi:methylenetetrahydrofolate reductase (NADPH)